MAPGATERHNKPHFRLRAGVVETPNGAHFTTCTPDYERDEKFQRAYAAAASGSDEDWAAFSARFLEGDEASYQAAVQAFKEEQA